MTLQCSNEEEAQRSNTSDHRIYAKLAVFEQVCLIAAEIIRSELVRRLSEMFGEFCHRAEIAAGCTIGVVAPLSYWAEWPAKPHENQVPSQRLGVARSRTHWRC